MVPKSSLKNNIIFYREKNGTIILEVVSNGYHLIFLSIFTSSICAENHKKPPQFVPIVLLVSLGLIGIVVMSMSNTILMTFIILSGYMFFY